MTEYELLDLLSSYHQSQVAVSMAFLTICSAYAAVIHFLGKRLNIYLLLILTAVYSSYIVLPIFGIFNASNRAQQLGVELQRLRGIEVQDPEPFIYSTIVFITIWGLTILYAVYIRRQTRNGINDDA